MRAPTTAYTSPEGGELVLRDALSPASVREIAIAGTERAAATQEDQWQRRQELLFERLAVSWAIAGLDPLTGQAELLARFRMASADERSWIRETIERHARERAPELQDLL